MKLTFKELEEYLRQHDIKPSYQRLKVLEYLLNNPIHPSVDKIYLDLHKDMPTLSKTTVYNTLKVLVDAGLVKAITILENECRYDGNIKTHGHFKCRGCDAIFDFSIEVDDLKTQELTGFKIQEKDVYFKGLCPNCQNTKKEE